MTAKLNKWIVRFFLCGIVGLLGTWLVGCGASVTPSVTVPPIKETVIVPATVVITVPPVEKTVVTTATPLPNPAKALITPAQGDSYLSSFRYF